MGCIHSQTCPGTPICSDVPYCIDSGLSGTIIIFEMFLIDVNFGQLIISNTDLDEDVNDLLAKISETYHFLIADETIPAFDIMKETLAQIAQVVQECAQFITNYSKTKKFCMCFSTSLHLLGRSSCSGMRLGKDVRLERNTAIANYNAALDSLMQQFRQGELSHIHVNVRQIGDTEGLHHLVCATGVGVDTRQQCPDGTAIEVLKEIVDWIDDPSPMSPRIFRLYGRDAKGRSCIANTIALHARNRGRLGSCFSFAWERQAERLHEKLFPTIARDLAARDIRLKPILADALTVDPSLGSTRDIIQQWKTFILEPLVSLKGPMFGNVVVVVDALDESGDDTSRKYILRCLRSTDAAKLPPNLRILVTSQPLVDIWRGLKYVGHIKNWSLNDIEFTTGDMGSEGPSTLGFLEGGQFMKRTPVFGTGRLAYDFISQLFFFG